MFDPAANDHLLLASSKPEIYPDCVLSWPARLSDLGKEQQNRRPGEAPAPHRPMLYAECGDRLTDAGADRPKLGLSPPNRTLPLSATLAGVARISMVIFSSCFCIVVSIPVVALRANRTDEVAALVQLSGIPFRAIAPKIGHPFTYIAALAVLSDKFGHVVSSPCAHIACTQPAASDTR
jgi:hypothetical protein